MNPIDKLKDENGSLDETAIKKIIPYEHPFLMIDKVVSVDAEKIIVIKKVDGNADYLKGHFVGFPIMPGALIVEGVGQAGTLLVRYNLENHETKDVLAYKITDAKFSAPALPGDELRYEVTKVGQDDRGALLQSKIYKADQEIAEATLMLAVVDKKEFREKYAR